VAHSFARARAGRRLRPRPTIHGVAADPQRREARPGGARPRRHNRPRLDRARASTRTRFTHVIHLAALLNSSDQGRSALRRARQRRGEPERLPLRQGTARPDPRARLRQPRSPPTTRAERPANPVPADAVGHPLTHYGVQQTGQRSAARITGFDDGWRASVLRPYIVLRAGARYGLKRRRALAMAAASAGRATHPVRAAIMLQHAGTRARRFIAAARAATEEARVFQSRRRERARPRLHRCNRAGCAAGGGQNPRSTTEQLPFPRSSRPRLSKRALARSPGGPLDRGTGDGRALPPLGAAVSPAAVQPSRRTGFVTRARPSISNRHLVAVLQEDRRSR